jgi:predicted Rossmann-fold nucleotide-binding protein
MKYGIVGSRQRKDVSAVECFIQSLPKNSIIVTGGARGVDTFAENAAKRNGFECLVFKPELTGAKNYYDACERYYDRNKKIVDNSDIIVAFVSKDRKGGTENTIKQAQVAKKPVQIIHP